MIEDVEVYFVSKVEVQINSYDRVQNINCPQIWGNIGIGISSQLILSNKVNNMITMKMRGDKVLTVRGNG